MSFDPLTWAIGFSLSTVGKYVLDKIFSRDLPSNLNKEVESWVKELPRENQFNHEALFDTIISDSDIHTFPHLATLREKLRNKRVPNSEVWLNALLERWDYVRSHQGKEDLHPFFAQDFEKAKEHLFTLAKRLETTCKTDQELFQSTIYDDIQEIKDYNREHTLIGSQKVSILVDESLHVQIEQLSSALSKEKAARLEEYRELYREGHVDEAYSKIHEITEDANWRLLDKTLKARIFRVLASYVLNERGDVEEAKKLIEHAHQEDPDADFSVINVFLEYHANGADAALKLLTDIHDVDALNLKCALLLEAGHADQVFLTLSAKPVDVVENAETKRLRALSFLFQGKLSEAQAEIERALYENPRWEGIRIAAAVIDYYSQLSPSLLPRRMFPWPEPVSLPFIKNDKESIERLRKAEKRFKELAEQDTRRGFHSKIWQLACLANDPERQDKAQDFCTALLAEDPGNPIVTVWALTRDYRFDMPATLSSLENTPHDAKDYNLRILALLDLYLNEEKAADALRILQETKEQFVQAGAEDTWLIWHAKTLVQNGQPEEALNDVAITKNKEVQMYIKTFALKELSRRSNDWEPFLVHLEDSYKQTGDGQLFYECCRLKAHIGDWKYIAERCEELIGAVHTHAAVELAAKAAWQAKRPDLCLKILNDNSFMFFNGVLPVELHRLRVYCQSRIGLLPQALADAEALFEKEASTENLLALMEMQFRKGDLKGLTNSASKLSGREDASCIDLLRAARLVMFEDTELAYKLWRQASEAALHDPLCVNQAIEIGFRLGLDKELSPLLQKMQEFSARGLGSVRMVDFESLILMMKEYRERAEFITQKYEAGEIPAHIFAEALNVSLVKIYHDVPEQNRKQPNPLKQAIIFARHGGRTVQKSIFSEQAGTRLHLDVTALLLSWHLGILDKVEQSFKPLRISPALQTALISQRDKITFPQPGRIGGYRQVLALWENHQLQEEPRPSGELEKGLSYLIKAKGRDWVLLLKGAVAEKSYLVEFFPLRSNDIKDRGVELRKRYRQHVINCRSLIKSLWKAGKLSEEKYLDILRNLGTIVREKPIGHLPPLGAKIHLSSGIACELALANALPIVCQQYKVFVDITCIEEAQQYIRGYERSQELSQWIDRLISRVRDGLDKGIYEIISFRVSSSVRGNEEFQNPDLRTMTDLFEYASQSGDAIWIDDRFCNSYIHRDGVPIVGILEILKMLRTRKVIGDAEYYALLLQLRACNFRYIPIEARELLYHLKQAKITDNAISETEELSILRRYLNACLLDSSRLQMPPVFEKAANPNGEITFILRSMRSISEAITHLWKDETLPDKTVEAYADWILVNLYFGIFSTRHLRKTDDPDNDGLDLIGLDIGSLFTQGIHFNRDSQQERRRKYFSWLDQRLVRNRFRANPGAIVATVRTLQHLMSSMINMHHKDKHYEMAARLILQDFYLDLPESIRNEMVLEQEMLEWLGIKTVESLRMGKLWFSASEFWLAVREAMHGEQATVKPLQSENEVNIEYDQKNGKCTVKVKDAASLVEYNMDDQMMKLLLDDPDERRDALLSNRIWFDCDNVTLEKIVADIIATEDYVTRIRKITGWRDSSAAFYYDKLTGKLTSERSFKFEDLMPKAVEGFIRYFRFEIPWQDERTFHEIMEKSAEILIIEEGLRIAVERFACLPIFLPEVIRNEFTKLSIEKKKSLLSEFDSRWASPISRLHLIGLALMCFEDKEFLISFIKKIMDFLYDDVEGLSSYRLFKAILIWASNELSYSAGSKEWPTAIKLSVLWAHTSMLQNIFKISGAPQDEMAQIFESRDYILGSEILDRDLLMWGDVLHPLRVNRTTLIIHGLSRIMREYGKELIAEIDIANKMKDYISKSSGEGALPEFFIFNDPALLRDCTESILSGDRGTYLDFLGSEIAQQISSDNLKAIVRNAIEALLSDHCLPQEWLKIYSIVGDLPLYEDLRGPFGSLLQQVDIPEIVEKSPLAALLAMRVIAKQAVHTGEDQIRFRLENALVQLATFFTAAKGDEVLIKDASILKEETIAVGLLEDVLNIALRPNSPRETSREFSKLLGKIFEVWPLTMQKLGNGIFRLAHELPAEQLYGLWPLIFTYRARRNIK